MMGMRVFVGCFLIRSGMAIIPRDVRKLVRDAMLYHVPGALTPDEKAGVEDAKSAWVIAMQEKAQG